MSGDAVSRVTPQALEQLLQRGDVWRGQSERLVAREVLGSGYGVLDAHLLHQGWPLGSLIEVCQKEPGQGEWFLFLPSLLPIKKELLPVENSLFSSENTLLLTEKKSLAAEKKLIATEKNSGACWVLVNPPYQPFVQGLLQAGVDLDRLLIVEAKTKAEFLSTFIELTRSSLCAAVLAWQTTALNYTDLRKCLLATQESNALCVLFRHLKARQQSSPAQLRLSLAYTAQELQIDIFKQKGNLTKANASIIHLPFADAWAAVPQHADLGQKASDITKKIIQF